eukprot:6921041-Lingulodinium_polyedra.AAC.1
MPVSFPARSARCLATAGNSCSPIIYFCSEGRAAANAAAHRGAPAVWACPLRYSKQSASDRMFASCAASRLGVSCLWCSPGLAPPGREPLSWAAGTA